jgi:ABC-type branched-subunit amino acid transport system substrate-binding protein
MPKRKRTTEKLDTVQNARRVFIEATQTTELTIVQQVMREMGAKGGKIGGKRRLETMTDAQRTKSAKKAAKARWAKAKKNP